MENYRNKKKKKTCFKPCAVHSILMKSRVALLHPGETWISAPSGSPGCRCFPLLVTQYPPQVSDWWYLSACAQIILVLLHSVPKAQESWHWQFGYSTSKLQMGSSKWKVESCPVPGRGLTYYNVLHKCPVLLLVTITLTVPYLQIKLNHGCVGVGKKPSVYILMSSLY